MVTAAIAPEASGEAAFVGGDVLGIAEGVTVGVGVATTVDGGRGEPR
jgi:hypothetical protein